jgi:glucose-1-phosphate cytidylyltransferase
MGIESAMILAGGLGTRFKEYTKDIPKPMVKANGVPLLIHIINFYKTFGVKKFYILAGYKKEIIYDYFNENETQISKEDQIYDCGNNVNIQIIDTGDHTLTGGRIKKGLEYIDENLTYLTYGDGISNVDLNKLYEFHVKQNPIATLTAVRPPARFGSLDLDGEKVAAFNEKNQTNEGWINGGFFILNKEVKKYIDNDNQAFEKEPLTKLANERKLAAFKHHGLFRPVDTIRELEILESELKENEFNFSNG